MGGGLVFRDKKINVIFERANIGFACFQGAMKLYFRHYSCGVIILLNTGLDKSAFSTYSFGKLVFILFVFSAFSVFLFYLRKFYKIYLIIVFIDVSYSVILFSLYKNQFVKTNTYVMKV